VYVVHNRCQQNGYIIVSHPAVLDSYNTGIAQLNQHLQWTCVCIYLRCPT